jgi:plasmid maintenance system antidote protein VapI
MQVTVPKLPGYEALMTEFQERLKRLSQTEVARIAGTTAQHVCDVVSGRRPPNSQLIAYLGFEMRLAKTAGRKNRLIEAATQSPLEPDSAQALSSEADA